MHTSHLSRAISFCLAASVTLAMLGGIDSLARPDAVASAPAAWAQVAQHLG